MIVYERLYQPVVDAIVKGGYKVYLKFVPSHSSLQYLSMLTLLLLEPFLPYCHLLCFEGNIVSIPLLGMDKIF